MAPLQKRDLYGLILGLLWAAAIIVVFIIRGGVTEFTEDRSFRLIMDIIFIGGLLVYLALMASFTSLRRTKKGEVKMDERDTAILQRAPLVQLWAVILSLVTWAICLTEIYWDEGAVPVIFLYLLFFSSLITSTLAQSLGILIGYWRMNRG
ncbi:MAG: hypothetical protein WC369_02465 [Dehalococcoidales bacterium]|jgi:amino acid transporter